MKTETHCASENMKLFFERLLAVKERIKKKALDEGDLFLHEIARELDSIIKTSNISK